MLVGSFGNAALAAVVPVLIGIAFDAALESPPDLRAIGLMALGVIVSQTVRAVLQLGRNFSSAVMGERLERDMREELYVSLLGKSTAFHDFQPVGDTMARATNDVHEVNLMEADDAAAAIEYAMRHGARQVVLFGCGRESEAGQAILESIPALLQGRVWDATGRTSIPQLMSFSINAAG